MKSERSINIVYVSNVNINIYGISKFLPEFNIHTIGSGESYKKIKKNLKINKPDVLLLEFEFMDNDIISLIQKIAKENPEIKLLILSAFTQSEFAKTLLENGAHGYYDHHCTEGFKGVANAIKKVLKGNPVIKTSPYKRKTYMVQE